MKQLVSNRFILITLAAAIAILAFSAWIHYSNTVALNEDTGMVAHTHQALDLGANTMRMLVDAQTGMRGFVIANVEEFLAPYHAAIDRLPKQFTDWRELIGDNPRQVSRVNQLEEKARELLDALATTIATSRKSPAKARELVTQKNDKRIMDAIRQIVLDYELEEHSLLKERQIRSTKAYHAAVLTNLVTTGLALLIVGVCAALVFRDNATRRENEHALKSYNAQLEERIKIRTSELSEAKESAEASEDRVRAIVETAHDAFVAMDASGNIIGWNRQSECTFGWSREEALGKSVAKLIIPDELQEPHNEGLSEFLRSGVGPILNRRLEFKAMRRGGQKFPIEITVSPIKRKDTVIFSAFVRDITERREYEHALHAAKETAENASRAKSEFLANMSHEIRTPMNAIIGMTELTLGTVLSTQQREYISTVQQSADALLTIINDILDFSKIEAGKLAIDPVPFRLRDSLGDILRPLAIRAHDKNLELAYDVDTDTPDSIIGDLNRLRQILINLVGNAIKFTHKGEVVVRVRSKATSDRQLKLQFSVEDTGIGIAEDKLGSIFAPFEQADGSMARRFGGTGLGLTISSRLVGLLGGALSVDSKYGQGTTFTFTVQMEFDANATDDFHAFESLDLKGMRVLVVDDNETNGRILEEILKNWRMLPTITTSGKSAEEAFLRGRDTGKPFQLILLDSNLFDTSGLEVAQKLSPMRMPGSDVLIMLTSASSNVDSKTCSEHGIARCLTKPVKHSDLLESIQSTLAEKLQRIPAQPSLSDANNPELARAQKPLNILLAEDNYFNQRVLLGILAHSGHRITVVENGRQAIEAVKGREFDLIFMDVQMPEMDGLQATSQIRELESQTGKHTPIVALTAHAMTGDRERFLQAGMDDYVSKPIRRAELFEVLFRYNGTSEPTIAETPTANGEVFDRVAFLDRIGGDVELAIQLVELFPDECREKLQEIAHAHEAGDAAALKRIAHTLSGLLGQLSAGSGAEAAHQLEETAARGSPEQLAEAVNRLTAELHRVRSAVIEFLVDLKSSFQ